MDKKLQLQRLLSRSSEFGAAISHSLAIGSSDSPPQSKICRSLCSVSLEHANSIRLLIEARSFTSAVGLLRLQYEAFVRAIWFHYAASDSAVARAADGLASDISARSEKQPMLSEMLKNLEGKAPELLLTMLLEFKQYSWKPLSSFVHGGKHAIARSANGYPVQLLDQALRASNGVSMMAGMLLVLLSNDPDQLLAIAQLKEHFADCMPPYRSPND